MIACWPHLALTAALEMRELLGPHHCENDRSLKVFPYRNIALPKCIFHIKKIFLQSELFRSYYIIVSIQIWRIVNFRDIGNNILFE